MNKEKCAELMAEWLPEGKEILKEHLVNFNEILLHVLAGEVITEPLIEFLHANSKSDMIEKYCYMIELMWKKGNEEVNNVVDVTILERLSDDIEIWNRFGEYISDEFKRYINDEAISNNIALPSNQKIIVR